MNEAAKNALAKWRQENPDYKPERLTPTERAKANPKSKALAIKAYCWECCNESKDEVQNCTVVKCPLHPHRPWQKSKNEDVEDTTEE